MRGCAYPCPDRIDRAMADPGAASALASARRTCTLPTYGTDVEPGARSGAARARGGRLGGRAGAVRAPRRARAQSRGARGLWARALVSRRDGARGRALPAGLPRVRGGGRLRPRRAARRVGLAPVPDRREGVALRTVGSPGRSARSKGRHDCSGAGWVAVERARRALGAESLDERTRRARARARLRRPRPGGLRAVGPRAGRDRRRSTSTTGSVTSRRRWLLPRQARFATRTRSRRRTAT